MNDYRSNDEEMDEKQSKSEENEEKQINVDRIVDKILTTGPDRVMIGTDGEAITSKRAKEAYQITPDIVFIRNDEWTLGAEFGDMEDAAYELWLGSWTHFYLMGDPSATPIDEY